MTISGRRSTRRRSRSAKPPGRRRSAASARGGTGWAQEYDPTIDGGLNLSRIIHKDFATAHDSAFQWWVALSEMYGSDPEARNDKGWNDGPDLLRPGLRRERRQTLYFTSATTRSASTAVRAAGRGLHNVTGGAGRRGGDPPTTASGRWVVVVNNHNTTDTALNCTSTARPPGPEPRGRCGPPPTRTGPTWHGRRWPAAPCPRRSRPVRSPRTCSRRRHGSSALTGALVGGQSGKCLTADASGAAIATCTGTAGQAWSYDARGTLRGANGYLTAADSGLTTAPAYRGDGTSAGC
ncbi:hypothetical protein LT493_39860 [Streptomyces tricolor]|nr:hypothetical protein [Streptomyces tricolor]